MESCGVAHVQGLADQLRLTVQNLQPPSVAKCPSHLYQERSIFDVTDLLMPSVVHEIFAYVRGVVSAVSVAVSSIELSLKLRERK